MSYSEVLIAPCVGPVEPVQKFRNSWGFGFRIWDAMSVRYLGKSLADADRDWWPTWNLWKRTDIPEGQRAVLMCPFDYAMIEWDRLKDIAVHFRTFAKEFPYEGEDHLPAMADLFDNLALSGRQDMAGVCFYPMSVGENLWYTEKPGQKKARPYDVSRDKEHWFVFEALKDLETGDPLPHA